MRLDLINFRGVAHEPASLLPQWRVGAVLEAIALRDATSGQLWLQLGGQRHPARIASGDPRGPQDGERLQVRVLRNSPVLALETLAPAKLADLDTHAAAEALRRYLPRQESPALLLANIAWLARSVNDAKALPQGVLRALAQLWRALPTTDSLTDPDGLAGAIKRSGAFLESNLAKGDGASTAADLKALLLQLGRALRNAGARPDAASSDAGHSPTPLARGPLAALPSAPATLALLDTPAQQLNELARQTEGALARITATQIANGAPEGQQLATLVELPMLHEDRASVLRLRVERDGCAAGGEDAEGWSIEAAIDLGAPGALHARVAFNGRRIAVQLRAESASVLQTLSARSAELEAALRGAGLEIDRIVCLHGLPAGENGARRPRLLDVRA
ncbi:MAG TPA: flagellar hook-length control protein FliK [Steroidobacter sp.]|nr:flagellar hook-length control protein FliK [Steroidobacter sp.]